MGATDDCKWSLNNLQSCFNRKWTLKLYLLGMFVKRLRAILIDRALYKYCIIIIVLLLFLCSRPQAVHHVTERSNVFPSVLYA